MNFNYDIIVVGAGHAGLQLICAILFISIVMSNVFEPRLAAVVAASLPACPAPITIISYLKSIIPNWFEDTNLLKKCVSFAQAIKNQRYKRSNSS